MPLLKDRPRKYKPPTVEQFRRLYFEQKKSFKEIAAIFQTPDSSLRRWFHRHRDDFAEQLRLPLWKSKHKWSRRRGSLKGLSTEMFLRLYFEEEESLQDIADMFGVSRTAVHQWFRRHKPEFGIGQKLKQLRPVGKRTKHKYAERLFMTWSPEMAYVLGLLATDGSVLKNRVIFSSTDLELVEKVRSLIGTGHPIYRVRPRGYSRKMQYKLDMSSTKLVQQLGQLGIHPRKSRTLLFPEMPEDCFRHFLRGCWDGDGSFLQGKQFGAAFVTGSRNFALGVARCLKEAGIRPPRAKQTRSSRRISASDMVPVYEQHRGGKVVAYQLKLSARNAIRLGRWLYDGVSESMYLRRKHDVFRLAERKVYVFPLPEMRKASEGPNHAPGSK